MPATCCVIGCNNRHSSSKKLRFYRIPRGKDQRCKFIKAIARHSSWEPNNSTRICSIHFESGSISKNKYDVDYAPTLYMDIGKECERGGKISLHERPAFVQTNETEFRDHITKLIDEASIMLKQREDNHLSQSIIFHDYVMPYHSHPVPEYVEPEVFTSDSNPTQELNSIAYNVLQTDSQNVPSSSKDVSELQLDVPSSPNTVSGGQPLDVVMMMSSASENLEHFWVADTLLKMGSNTHIAQPNNTNSPTTVPTTDTTPIPGAPLTASTVVL